MAQNKVVPVGGAVSEADLVPVGGDVSSVMGSTPDTTGTEQQSGTLPSGHPITRAISGFANAVNPIPLLQAVSSQGSGIPVFGLPPGVSNIAKGIIGESVNQGGQAVDAFRKGNYSEAVDRGINAIPLLGPAIASLAGKVDEGNLAGAAGEAAAFAIPFPGRAKPGTMGEMATKVNSRIASAAGRASTDRLVDIMAPKVGGMKFKTKMADKAENVAPLVAREPGLGALSREALRDKMAAKVDEFHAAYDALDEARDPTEIFDTAPLLADLKAKLNDITLEAASGPRAHEQVRAMGLDMPASAPKAGTHFANLPLPYKESARQLLEELREFKYQDRTWLDKTEEVAREGGNSASRGTRARIQANAPSDAPFLQSVAGSPVFHEILQGRSGTTRNAMIASLENFVEKNGSPTPITNRMLEVIDKRLRTPEEVSKPLLPEGAGADPGDMEKPIGVNVIPETYRPRAEVIQTAIKELEALGPAASRETLRRFRASRDLIADYEPGIADDKTLKKLQAAGAKDVTAATRKILAFTDEEAAKLNPDYSLWRNGFDAIDAAVKTERVRPRVLRARLSRGAGSIAGGVSGGFWGAVAGTIIAGGIEKIAASGVTTKIASARLLAKVEDALKAGDSTAAMAHLRQFARVTGQTAKLQASLKEQESE
jgi:hypothetical protein